MIQIFRVSIFDNQFLGLENKILGEDEDLMRQLEQCTPIELATVN